MKKALSFILLLMGILYFGSCTNDEGGNDLDVVIPDDTTETSVDLRR